jgi:hypothetical protein
MNTTAAQWMKDHVWPEIQASEACRIGIVFFDSQIGFVIKQAIKNMRRIAHRCIDDLGMERGILVRNVRVIRLGKSRLRDFRGPKGKRRRLSKVKFKGFLTRSRHPRTPGCAIALCSGSLPTRSPGSAPS